MLPAIWKHRPSWTVLVVVAIGMLGTTIAPFLGAQYGDPNPLANSELQALETKWAADPDATWQTSGTTICAGGKNSAVHQAKVHIVLASQAKGQTLTINLVGGSGYAPQRDWWTPDHQATPASLSFSVGSCSAGGTITTTVGNDDSDLDIEGTLTSSNTPENTTIKVQVGGATSASTSVSFGAPSYSNDLANQGFVLSDPSTFTATATYSSKPVDQHNLKFIVYTVTHGATVEQADPGDGYVHKLTGWVEIGTSGSTYQDSSTNAQGNAAGSCKVVDSGVSSFTIAIGDMSVAVPN